MLGPGLAMVRVGLGLCQHSGNSPFPLLLPAPNLQASQQREAKWWGEKRRGGLKYGSLRHFFSDRQSRERGKKIKKIKHGPARVHLL